MKITTIIFIIFISIIVIFAGYLTGTYFGYSTDSKPIPSISSLPTDIPSDTPIPTIDTEDTVTQSWYYCWDYGDPQPHHYGYPVSGDHLCTNRELGN